MSGPLMVSLSNHALCARCPLTLSLSLPDRKAGKGCPLTLSLSKGCPLPAACFHLALCALRLLPPARSP